MIIGKRVFVAIVAVFVGTSLLMHSAASSQTLTQGTVFFSPQIAGYPVSCTDYWGTPVPLVVDYQQNDVGHSNPQLGPSPYPAIYMNPTIHLRLPPGSQLFWFGHECAHQRLPRPANFNEFNADCWAAKTGRNQGWFSQADINVMAQYMHNNPGDWSHAPGPVRVRHIQDCFNDADDGSVNNYL